MNDKFVLYPPTKSGSKEMFNDFEIDNKEPKKELGILSVGDINDAQDRSVDQEIESSLEDGIHPDCDPDAPNQNMVADPVGGTEK